MKLKSQVSKLLQQQGVKARNGRYYYLDGSKGLVNYVANITAGLYNVQDKSHMAKQV